MIKGKNKKFPLYLVWNSANSSPRWVTQGESLSPEWFSSERGGGWDSGLRGARTDVPLAPSLEKRECVTRVGTIARSTISMEPTLFARKGIHMWSVIPI